MVNFNNDTTIGRPAVDVERISILQRRYDMIEAFEAYKKSRMLGMDVDLSIVRCRLMSLFIEVQGMLKRQLNAKDYLELYNICFESKNEKDILNAIFHMSEFLDSIKLTRVDTQPVYDYEDAEAENTIMGY